MIVVYLFCINSSHLVAIHLEKKYLSNKRIFSIDGLLDY